MDEWMSSKCKWNSYPALIERPPQGVDRRRKYGWRTWSRDPTNSSGTIRYFRWGCQIPWKGDPSAVLFWHFPVFIFWHRFSTALLEVYFEWRLMLLKSLMRLYLWSHHLFFDASLRSCSCVQKRLNWRQCCGCTMTAPSRASKRRYC